MDPCCVGSSGGVSIDLFRGNEKIHHFVLLCHGAVWQLVFRFSEYFKHHIKFGCRWHRGILNPNQIKVCPCTRTLLPYVTNGTTRVVRFGVAFPPSFWGGAPIHDDATILRPPPIIEEISFSVVELRNTTRVFMLYEFVRKSTYSYNSASSID